MKVKISVFTPTYNRASTLPNVYDCLCRQTFKNFEWIVVDDGSEDITPELIQKMRNGAHFQIKALRQDNSGKHIAQNRAVELASGELFLPLDSDDTVVDDALEILWLAWVSIPKEERAGYSGIGCHCKDQNGNRVGSSWPNGEIVSNDLEIAFKYKVVGEKWGPIRTDVMKQFLNEEVRGHFLDESTVWFRIAEKYKKLYINKDLRIYEVGIDSIQKRTYESDVHNAESKIHAYSLLLNEFYPWYRRYQLKSAIRQALKITYYAVILGKPILFSKDAVIKKVKPFICKLAIAVSSPYKIVHKTRHKVKLPK